jgi:hypothetical protein
MDTIKSHRPDKYVSGLHHVYQDMNLPAESILQPAAAHHAGRRRLIPALLLSLGLSVSTPSCNLGSPGTSAEKCGIRRPDGSLSTWIAGKRVDLKTWSVVPGTYSYASGEPDSAGFLIRASSGMDLPPEERTVALVLYTNPGSVPDTIGRSNISGVSRYYLDRNRLVHEFFLREAGVFQRIAALEREVPAVVTNHIHDIRKMFFDASPTTAVFMPTAKLYSVTAAGNDALSPVIGTMLKHKESAGGSN